MRLPLVAATAFTLLPAMTVEGQPYSVRGRVTSAGRPLAGVEIGVVDGPSRAVTADSGLFLIRPVPGGPFKLFARGIGYIPQVAVVTGASDSATHHDFALEPIAVTLDELRVEARLGKPARLAHTSKYDDFYRRRRSGGGSFLTREQIERSTAVRSFELLRGLPGVHVAWNPPGVPGTTVRFTRCTVFPPRISVWIDGVKQILHEKRIPARREEAKPDVVAEVWRDWLELFDAVGPRDIEAMEVFRGPSQIPAEFLDDSCAAVVIWTR